MRQEDQSIVGGGDVMAKGRDWMGCEKGDTNEGIQVNLIAEKDKEANYPWKSLEGL